MQFGLFGSATARRPSASDAVDFDSSEGFRDWIDYNVEADVSCFWYGVAGAHFPEIPAFARDIFARLSATIETDFDTD